MLRNRKRLAESNHGKTDVTYSNVSLNHSPLLPLHRPAHRGQSKALSFVIIIAFLLVCLCYHGARNQPRAIVLDYMITLDDYNRSISMLNKMPSCIITISAWRDYGQVRNLYESLESNDHHFCFIWFVADDPFTSQDPTINVIMSNMKLDWDYRFPIITLPVMQERLGPIFDDYSSVAFASNTEPETTAAMIPFAIQYGFDILGLQSIMYLKKDLWIRADLLPDVHTKFTHYDVMMAGDIDELDNESNLVANATYPGMFDIDWILLRKGSSAQRLLASWIDLLRTPWEKNHLNHHPGTSSLSFFSKNLHPNEILISYSHLHQVDTWDPSKGFSFHSPSIFQNFHFLPTLDRKTLRRMIKDKKAADFHAPGRLTTTNDDALTKYLYLWMQHKAFEYRRIPYGFNHFIDGTVVEPWMHALYQAIIQPVHMDLDYMDASDLAVSKIDVYSRLEFQDRIQKNPFLPSVESQDVTTPVTFMDWMLFSGPLDKVVEMNGLFYFSIVEEYVSTKTAYPYPEPGSLFSSPVIENNRDHDPTGANYDEFKWWFKDHVVPLNLLHYRLYERVQSSYLFHKTNHWSYHRQVLSPSDLGVNVIGWHGGIFGLGIQASRLYLAAKAVDLESNAVPLKPLLLTKTGPKYLNPKLLGYELTKSCSEAVNLITVNADYTYHAKSVIPELIWKFKYTIGYFQWEMEVFPRHVMNMMIEYDEIWVSTTFEANAIMKSPGYSNIPVQVVPIPLSEEDLKRPGVDDIDSVAHSPVFRDVMKRISEEHFVFLVVFDFWSMLERKNPTAAIRAFLEAFPIETDPEERYHLIVKSQNGLVDEIEQLEMVAQNDPRVHFLSDLIPTRDLKALQNRADCFISLHRCEGYGLNILEEMGRGIPVIATNYSGNVDFFHSVGNFVGTCIFPIPYKLIPVTDKTGLFEAGNRWAEPDHNSAVEAMKTVVKNDCKDKDGDMISAHIRSGFGPDSVGRKMKNALAESFERIQKKQLSFIENRRLMAS